MAETVNNNQLQTRGQTSISCSICLEAITDKDKLSRTISCGHHFCLDCIQDWTNKVTTCPNCRCNITAIMVNKKLIPVNTPTVLIRLMNFNGFDATFRYPVDAMFLPSMFDKYWEICPPEFKSNSVLRRNVTFYYKHVHDNVEATDTPDSLGMRFDTTSPGGTPTIMVFHKIKLNFSTFEYPGHNGDLSPITETRQGYVTVLIYDHVKIDEVLQRFCNKFQIVRSMFIFSCRGKLLHGLDEYSLHDLDFANGDCIDAVQRSVFRPLNLVYQLPGEDDYPSYDSDDTDYMEIVSGDYQSWSMRDFPTAS